MASVAVSVTKIGVLAAIGAVGVIATASAASASVTINGNTGFIGKGDVQTAFNLTNPAIQKIIDGNEGAFTFTSKQAVQQAVEQALSQSATQSASQSARQTGDQVVSQSATQEVTEVLSCVKSTGDPAQATRHGTRDATRTATREATRTGFQTGTQTGFQTGVRDGSRSGTILGNIDASIDAKARKTGQWTGWNIKSITQSPAQMGAPVYGPDQFPGYNWSGYTWSGYEFGSWSFDGYTFADFDFSGSPVSWGAWDTVNSNLNPDSVCSNNGNIVPGSLSDVITYGDAVAGPVDESAAVNVTGLSEDAVVENPVVEGDVVVVSTTNGVTAYGPVVVYASLNGGTPKQLNAV
jgi:hypothetical protein